MAKPSLFPAHDDCRYCGCRTIGINAPLSRLVANAEGLLQGRSICTAITFQRRLRIPQPFAEAMEKYLRQHPPT